MKNVSIVLMSRQNDDDEEYRHFGGIEQPKRTKMVAFEICPLRVIATFAFIYFALSTFRELRSRKVVN